MVYLHPWEIDPDQPRISASWLSRFRHYNNLDSTETKCLKLLDDFSWAPMEEVLAQGLLPIVYLIKEFIMVLKILSVVGARPNFIKIAAICEAIKRD